jgi:N-acetylmuramoyl-L-alanine amidase
VPNHRVKKGEWMGSIAAKYGFRSWESIWQAPENAELRQQRNDPNLLFQGDQVWIPERRPKQEPAATDARHVYVMSSDNARLRIRIIDVDPYIQAFGPISYVLEAEDGNQISGQITAEGQEIEIPIAISVERGTLHIGDLQTILIGGLDPIETASGMQARLQNLGFEPGPVDNIAGPRTAGAVREFQQRYKLTVDGIIGPETQSKMKEVYGC